MTRALAESPPIELHDLEEIAQVHGGEGDACRLAVPFTFKTDGLADAIAIQAAVLTGRFASHEYNVSSSTLSTLHGAVLVTLPSPRTVRRIRVKSSALDTPAQKLALHRVDVQAIADEPAVQVGNDTLAGDEFTDVRFAIYREGSKSLAPAQVEWVRVRSDPAGARLGLVVDGDEENSIYFWQGAAEIENADLAGTLDRFLNRRLAELAEQGQPKPDQIGVTLLFESTTPCDVEIDDLEIDYRIVVNSWTADLPARDGEKRVLRFHTDRVDDQSLSLVLPANASVLHATLKVVESQAGRPLQTGPAGSGAPLALAAPHPTEKSGVHVGVEEWVAEAVELGTALTASGVALAVIPLVEGTELRVALQESWHDQPSGSTLAEGTLRLQSPGRAVWANFPLSRTLTLSTQPYWLMLKAAEGQAVWLAHTGEGNARVWQQPRNKGTWHQVRDLGGRQLLFQFLTPRAEPQGAAAAESAAVQSTCRLTVGGQEVLPTGRTGDTVEYDLTGSLGAYLDAIPGEGAAPVEGVTIPLVFSAVGLKQLTVYPPEVEYVHKPG